MSFFFGLIDLPSPKKILSGVLSALFFALISLEGVVVVTLQIPLTTYLVREVTSSYDMCILTGSLVLVGCFRHVSWNLAYTSALEIQCLL